MGQANTTVKPEMHVCSSCNGIVMLEKDHTLVGSAENLNCDR